MRQWSPARVARLGPALACAALVALSPPSVAEAHEGCARIRVETREGRAVTSQYVVSEHDYVAKMHRLIDLNGDDGVWYVAAGDLAPAGYVVVYTCLP
jgi:hypothetical protein